MDRITIIQLQILRALVRILSVSPQLSSEQSQARPVEGTTSCSEVKNGSRWRQNSILFLPMNLLLLALSVQKL